MNDLSLWNIQLLRGNNATKMQIVNQLSSAMEIGRPADKMQNN